MLGRNNRTELRNFRRRASSLREESNDDATGIGSGQPPRDRLDARVAPAGRPRSASSRPGGRSGRHQLGRLRRRHERHLDPVRQPDPDLRRRRRRRPGAEHPAGPGLRRASSRRPACSSTTSCTRSRCAPGCPRARPARPTSGSSSSPTFTWVGNATIDGSGWTTISGTYTLPDEVDPAASQVYVGSANQAAPYTILVDDILITAPAAPPTTDIISFGRLRRRHDRDVDPVGQPDPDVRRRRRRRPWR